MLQQEAQRVESDGAGKRRAALLAKKKVKPPSNGALLSQKDVLALRDDRSPAVRAAIAKKFGGQFDQYAASEAGGLANAVLMMLIKDVAVEVRMTLSKEVSASANLPSKAVSKMARDDINVAMPILRNSPLLEDDELQEIVRTQSMQYALAIAGREFVSEDLCETLIDSGNRDVVLRVVGNAGAQIGKKTMERVIDEHRNDLEIQDRMVKRPALPFEITEQLIGIIGDNLEWELTKSRRLNKDEAAAIIKASRESSNVNITAKSNDNKRRIIELRERMHAGEFVHADVVKALRDGDIPQFEMGLALFAKLDLKTAQKLIYNDDRRRLACLCAAGEFNPVHYLTMRMALELAHEAMTGNSKSGDYGEESVRYVLNQYERLRLDPDKVRELLVS